MVRSTTHHRARAARPLRAQPDGASQPMDFAVPAALTTTLLHRGCATISPSRAQQCMPCEHPERGTPMTRSDGYKRTFAPMDAVLELSRMAQLIALEDLQTLVSDLEHTAQIRQTARWRGHSWRGANNWNNSHERRSKAGRRSDNRRPSRLYHPGTVLWPQAGRAGSARFTVAGAGRLYHPVSHRSGYSA